MTIANIKRFLTGTVAAIAIFATAQAEAGWRHHHGGGWGSSGGSWGSSGGSWGSSGGSWGSSGGYTVSYGSWGSSGGGWGSSGGYSHYSGGWGSSGGNWGSSGGGWRDVTPSHPVQPSAPANGDRQPAPREGEAARPADSSAGLQRNSGLLTVSVPAEAKVTVNGRSTNSGGTERHYVSRGLRPGALYTYEVSAEMIRDGQPVTETKSIDLAAGQKIDLAFFSNEKDQQAKASQPLRTTLILNVPADAKVTLSGSESSSTGPVRQFTTTKLAAGSSWDNYVIRAEIQRDGQTVSREQNISLKAGESRELTLKFDDEKIAGNVR